MGDVMSATLRDVAKLAGVSVATASRALQGNYPVSTEKQERIWEAVRQLHYAPNDAAQRLAEAHRLVRGVDTQVRHTYSVGLVLNLASTKVFSDPFWSLVLEGVKQELVHQQYHLRFVLTPDDLAQNRQRRLLTGAHVDGLIVLGEPYPCLEIGSERTVVIPINDAGTIDADPLPVDVVTCESRQAMARLTDHLIGLGHKRFGFIGPIRDRGVILRQELASHDIRLEPALVVETSWSAEEAHAKAHVLLQGGTVPDVLVCANDGIAIGVMRAAKECGLRLPDDLAVTGFDNITFARDVDPPLTTVNVPKELLGEVAVRKLVERINRPDLPPVIQVVPTSLVIRASCGARRRDGEASVEI